MDRYISMAAPSVSALLAGQKTATRRLVSRANSLVDGEVPTKAAWARLDWSTALRFPTATLPHAWSVRDYDGSCLVVTPRWQPGDLLLCREALAKAVDIVAYAADGTIHLEWLSTMSFNQLWRWKRDVLPAMYCPRDVVRIRRRLVSVAPSTPGDVTTADEGLAEGLTYDRGPFPCAGYEGTGRMAWSWLGQRSIDHKGVGAWFEPLEAYRALLRECHGRPVDDGAPCWRFGFEGV